MLPRHECLSCSGLFQNRAKRVDNLYLVDLMYDIGPGVFIVLGLAGKFFPKTGYRGKSIHRIKTPCRLGCVPLSKRVKKCFIPG